jgi:anaerobic magnesium-protoporphyrin IX monomethyl ester cyclase
MKALLIQPPSAYHRGTYPLGLAYLAAVLEGIGWDVRIIDGSARNSVITLDQIVERARSFTPDFIGVTLVINLIDEGYRLAGKLSGLGIPLVAGGPHAKLRPHEVLEHGFDIVVRGEGEETIKDLAAHFRDKRDIADIPGISYKDARGSRIDNPDRPYIADLDLVPFPARHLFSVADYLAPGQEAIDDYWTIQTSRGCPNSCIYCAAAQGVFGRRYRTRSVENVMAELAVLKNTYGARRVKFYDDSLTIARPRLEKLCDMMIGAKLGMSWVCDSRADGLDRQLLRRMKEAGCCHIYFGVESYDPETLALIKKGVTAARIKEAIDSTVKEGIDFTVYLIMGWPWENRGHIDHTHDFFKTLPVSARFKQACFVPVPYPGTELYEKNHEKYGFTQWWLKPGAFDRACGGTGYVPYFKESPCNLDHFFLKKNFFRHSKPFQAYLKKVFIQIGKAQNRRIYGARKAFLINRLSALSLILYMIHPALERIFFTCVRACRAKVRVKGKVPSA